jgi:hypothetical protein
VRIRNSVINLQPFPKSPKKGKNVLIPPYFVETAIRNQIVLHEDKKYYATAEETYGADVETLVQEEDAQPLSEPIVQPIKIRNFAVKEKNLPVTRYEKSFMLDLMDHPSMIRNVLVAGHLHHGKTSLLDMMVLETHQMAWDADKPVGVALEYAHARGGGGVQHTSHW